jgi:hypothetical protein
MKRSKFTEAQIAFILRQADEGTAVGVAPFCADQAGGTEDVGCRLGVLCGGAGPGAALGRRVILCASSWSRG